MWNKSHIANRNMEFPKRKSNRLKGFEYSSNGLYFITVCTEKRKNLLCRIVGGGAFDAPKAELTYMGKVAEKYIFTSERIPNITVDK